MAVRFAVKSGNFSDPTVWDNGAVPLTDDDVYANGFTVTLDTDATVRTLRNSGSGVRVPNIATPAMTSNSTPSGVAFAAQNGSNAVSAFNQNYSQNNSWNSGINGVGTLGYQFPTAKTIARYGIYFFTGVNASQYPRDWTFQGSNDGTNYTVLDTRTGVTFANPGYNSFLITSPASYTYYRIVVTATANGTANPVEITELEMTESTGTVLGNVSSGSFVLNGGITFTASNGVIANVSGAITYSANSPAVSTFNTSSMSTSTSLVANGVIFNVSGSGTLTINSSGTLSVSSNGNNGRCINSTSSGILNINATTLAQSGAEYAIYLAGAGTANVTIANTSGLANNTVFCNSGTLLLNATSGTISGSGNSTFAPFVFSGTPTVTINGSVSSTSTTMISHTGAGTFTINGDVSGSTAGNFSGNVILNINGNVTAGAGAALAISGASAAVNVSGNVTASATAVGITFTSTGMVTVNGNLVNNSNGMMAVYTSRLNISASSTQTWNMFRAGGIARDLLTPDQIVVSGTFPAVTDVRSGVTYGMGTYTGTCAMPSYLNVTLGVPVDAGTGAAYTPANIADLIWNQLTSTLTVSGSAGERVKNIATVHTTGAQIAALRR